MKPPAESLALSDAPLAVAESSAPLPLAKMIQGVLESKMTPESVGVVERLTALFERQQARDAEREYARAFAELQSEMPQIIADKVVPDKHGNPKFRFAPYNEIMDEVRPLLLKHRFTVTFSMDFREGRIIQTCTLQHVSGHSRSNNFAVRIGGGPPGATESQADGAAATYAKRYALCSALNITIEQETTDGPSRDAAIEGAPISYDKVQYLKEQVKATGSDPVKFLRFAGVDKFEDITDGIYPSLVQSLQKKARQA